MWADAWLIAFARAAGGAVVTFGPGSSVPRRFSACCRRETRIRKRGGRVHFAKHFLLLYEVVGPNARLQRTYGRGALHLWF